jgi:hypothetical protein
MAILPTIMQGSAMCAALLESALTALLYRQVRKYGAEAPKLAPPRKRRSSDRMMTTQPLKSQGLSIETSIHIGQEKFHGYNHHCNPAAETRL